VKGPLAVTRSTPDVSYTVAVDKEADAVRVILSTSRAGGGELNFTMAQAAGVATDLVELLAAANEP